MKPRLLFLLLLAGCSAPKAAAPTSPATCGALPAPVIVPVEDPRPGEVHELFDLADTPAWWSAAPEDEAAARYRSGVTARLGRSPEPRALLERQRAILSAGGELLEAENGRAVLEGRAGTIGVPNCLERALFARQAARYPMVEHPTELGAFVVRGGGRVKVYFSSADRVGQKIRGEVTDRVRADVAAGLELVAHLHNHPFLFDRRVGDRTGTIEALREDVAGALAPSLADVQFYRRFGADTALRGAWLTNGIDAIHFRADELSALRSADERAAK